MNKVNTLQFGLVWGGLFLIAFAAGMLGGMNSGNGNGVVQGMASIPDVPTSTPLSVSKSARLIKGSFATGIVTNDESKMSSALPFNSETIGGSASIPFIAAIVKESGQRLVYIKSKDEDTMLLGEGQLWNEWLIERIEPSKVYFSNSEEKFDFFVFASVRRQ